MQRRFAALAFVAVVFLNLALCNEAQASNQEPGTTKGRHSSNPTAPVTINDNTGQTLQQNRPTQKAEADSSRVEVVRLPPKDLYDYWTFGATLALSVVGIAGIFIGLLTLGAIRKQAKAQMDADRAWVLARVGGQPQEPLTGAIIKTGAIPGVVWKIKISGNTPAQIMRERYRCRTVQVIEGRLSLEEAPRYLTNEKVVREATVFPSGYEYAISTPLEPNADRMTVLGEMAEVTAGARAFCAYGRIEYKDAFGREAVSQFCAIYRPRLGGVIKSPDGTDLNAPGFYVDGPEGYNYNT